MNSQKIICKATSAEEIRYKETLGVDGVEWQIIDKYENYKIDYFGLPIYSVHTRLCEDREVVIDNIAENFSRSEELTEFTRHEIMKTFKVCEELAQRQGFRVQLVLHLNNGAFIDKSSIIEFFCPLFELYPDVDIAVENSMLTSKNHIRNGVLSNDVPDFVVYFRSVVGEKYKNRICSVLDICHASATIRMINLLYGRDIHFKEEDSLEQYFKDFQHTCKIVHFNYLRDLGMQPNHGTSMTDTEFRMCYGFYMKYLAEANLVVEMREFNYHNCINLRKTVKQIRNYHI